jgi:predicted  nucleic acid-binding Zn-ribbon protein
MSYSVEELKVMLKKALATAKANRLNLEEVLEENMELRNRIGGLQAQIQGLRARIGQQAADSANIESCAHDLDILAGDAIRRW